MTLLLGVLRLLVVSLLGAPALASDGGIATHFGDPGDRHMGAHLSCTNQRLDPRELICAHRTLPCGTVVGVANVRTGRLAFCRVLDRGPYDARLPTGRIGLKVHKRDPGRWRGLIDLSPAVASALELNGREPVRIVYYR